MDVGTPKVCLGGRGLCKKTAGRKNPLSRMRNVERVPKTKGERG